MDPNSWETEFEELIGRIGPRFARSESRRMARGYLSGLFSGAERKNGWQLAEALGQSTPYALQQFLYRGGWQADEVRDDMRNYVVEQLGDEDGVLVVDETGFLKKGTKSVGVQRQYSGTAGRIENCQIGVFVVYASRHGATFLDRELYLPESWTSDPDRCRAAGIPDNITFATKPQLAQAMLERALDAGVPARWVTGDCVYGDPWKFRRALEQRAIGYVLAVTCTTSVNIAWRRIRVEEVTARLGPDSGWSRINIGDGAKGPRAYDWHRVELTEPELPGWSRWLLIRRSIADPTVTTAYLCFGPDGTTLEALARVAGSRWTVETCFEEAKGEVGLDHYEVRSWGGWYRHITLACLAHSFLAVIRAKAVAGTPTLEKGGLLNVPSDSLRLFRAGRGLSSA